MIVAAVILISVLSIGVNIAQIYWTRRWRRATEEAIALEEAERIQDVDQVWSTVRIDHVGSDAAWQAVKDQM